MNRRERLVIGVTGASGAVLAVRMLEVLAQQRAVETHLVISEAARLTIRAEVDRDYDDIEALATVVYRPQDVGAAIASGSFTTKGMVVIPCSIKTLSAIAHCYASDLIARAADVTLKEGRPLLLVMRETPLHVGHLRIMTQAAESGSSHIPRHARLLRSARLCGRHREQHRRPRIGTAGSRKRTICLLARHARHALGRLTNGRT